MFDGFGLFGTGIGTGFFGKVEDLLLGAQCAAANVKVKQENTRLAKELKQYEMQEQSDNDAEATADAESSGDDRRNAEYEEEDKI